MGKAATSKAEQTVSELRSKCEDAEKKNTILGIKLETAIEEHSALNEQNAILNHKLDELKSNIGNAEGRSEQAARDIEDMERRVAVAEKARSESDEKLENL